MKLSTSLVVLAGAAAAVPAVPNIAASAAGTKQCALPSAGGKFETATPEEVGLDSAAVAKAIAYANTHNRISLQIFRHNCLVATGAPDFLTDDVANNIFSSTKSVVSILTGIAMDMGKLKLDDKIDKYLPNEPGWGDAAHGAITIHDLLTETAGLQQSIMSEGAMLGLDASLPQEALALKIVHQPGTYFEYTQRVPDLLAYIVSRAVGQELQAFAQEHLFDVIGIPKNKYFWLRDRSGNSYGQGHIFMSPSQYAKLGLLMQHTGSWNGKQVVSSQYVADAAKPSEHNPCYGYLFWNNAGESCTGAALPAAQTYQRHAIPAAPYDTFFMFGALHQNNFMVPSLDMTVTWTGFLGDTEPNLSVLLSAAAGDLYNNFFSLLMDAVKDQQVPHVGFLPLDPIDFDINPLNYANPMVLLASLVSSPQCNIIWCNNTIPTKGLLQNLESFATLLLAAFS